MAASARTQGRGEGESAPWKEIETCCLRVAQSSNCMRHLAAGIYHLDEYSLLYMFKTGSVYILIDHNTRSFRGNDIHVVCCRAHVMFESLSHSVAMTSDVPIIRPDAGDTPVYNHHRYQLLFARVN